MLTTQQDKLAHEIDALVKHHGKDRSALIPILQDVKKQYHEISDFAMQTIADRLGIHPVEVYGVVTFYAFLKDGSNGKFVIRLCRTLSCDFAGKDAIAQQLMNDLGIKFGETTKDGRFSLEWANCIGMCDQGPAMLVNEKVFAKVTPEKVHEILSACEKTFGASAAEKEHAHE